MNFLNEIKEFINSGISRSIVLTGNIYDLFYDERNDRYVHLVDLLKNSLVAKVEENRKGIEHISYTLNNEINASFRVADMWDRLHQSSSSDFSTRIKDTVNNIPYSLEMLRQICLVNSKTKESFNIICIIEAADMLFPDQELNRLNRQDRKSLEVVFDWFTNLEYIEGGNTTIMLAESRNSIHHRISRLPQVVEIEIPLPSLEDRLNFMRHKSKGRKLNKEDLANKTSGLSLHALRQLLTGDNIDDKRIYSKVEEYMTSQLGEGVVEFKKPTHRLADVVGNSKVKKFFANELIPSFLNGSISGAAVGGPIGSGKTFICEAVAAELNIPVITLKNIRSKWYGETDKIFERLRRLLECFEKMVIFVDEADTQFGSVDNGHDTEKRLTGKIQAMMSDNSLKGRVIWFLMTARIDKLSPDIRREGRMDLIIPILDPSGDDIDEFIKWSCGDLIQDKSEFETIKEEIGSKPASFYQMIKNHIKSKKIDEWIDLYNSIEDFSMPNTKDTRDYQSLQAKLNCTRKSLIFDAGSEEYCNYDDVKDQWEKDARLLKLRIHDQ